MTLTSPEIPCAPTEASGRAEAAVCDRNESASLADIVWTLARSLRSGTRMCSVLIFGESPEPVRQLRMDVQDPVQIPATATALTIALQRSGVNVTAEHDPQVPGNELWITFRDTHAAVMNIP